MVAAGKRNDAGKKAKEDLEQKLREGSKKKPPPLAAEEDYEDGDIATPKRDRYGTDDEPL